MKKTLILLLLASVLAILTGCGIEYPPTVVNADKFLLTITVEETALAQGTDFAVDVALKNISNKNIEIVHSFLFWPFIQGWQILDEWGGIVIDPPQPRLRLLEPNGVINETWLIGNSLEPGIHELKFRAAFHVYSIFCVLEEKLLYHAQDDLPISEQTEIWSNAVTLAVQ
jgi:predicted small lipoprotein YifL